MIPPVPRPRSHSDIIDAPLVGEEDRTRPNHIPRSILVGIIRPRIEETFELVRSRYMRLDAFDGASASELLG